MKYNVLLFLFISSLAFSQHEDLLKIIDDDTSLEIRQQKIDSLLRKNETQPNFKILADCYHDLGSKWYFRNWRATEKQKWIYEAIESTQKAVKLKKRLDTVDKTSLKKSLYNLGVFHSFNGDVYAAIGSFNDLIEVGEADTKTQFANLELGRAYAQIGDFHKAINSFKRILIYYKNSSPDFRRLMMAHIDLAGTYSLMGFAENSSEIKFHLKKADSIYKITGDENIDLITDMNQIEGNRLLETNNYVEAIGYHKKVLADSLYMDDNSLARVYNSIAFSQLELGDYESARSSLYKATLYDLNYTDPYENLGDLYLKQNEFEKGLYQYQKAIIYATDKNREIKSEELLSTNDFELATEKIFLLNHIVTKANGWLQYYEYDKNKSHLVHALETFTIADQLVDIIRFESTENQSKLFWREKGSSLYMKAVEASYLLNKPKEAYYFMERNKALLLLEDVSNEQAKEIAQLPDSVAKREFDLKRSILLAENELQIAADASAEDTKELRDKIYGHKREYDQFAATLTKAYPDYANLKKKVDVLPYKRFKTEHVSEYEVILQYILNDEQGYGLLSTMDQTHFFKLKNSRLLNEQLLTLYAQLTDMTSSREKLSTYNKTANAVFHTLIPKEVHSAIKGKNLTLVADNILQQIPFEALVADLEQSTYLIEEVEIRYAYSVSYLSAKKGIKQKPEKELLGLAPIQFIALGLPKLAFSGEEINEVHKFYSGEVALNGDATKSRLLDAMNNFRILHLSTHADVGEGGNPWIAFSDEKLFLNEIYASKNQAEMVVLSGCNTSLGELKKGEGAMSLARGFFHSGAKSVVSSLWTISDKSSKNLMTDFYKGLDKGLTKAAALREAKIAYITKFKGTTVSPSFWAGLIVIGDNSPINTVGFSNNTWLWVLLGIVVLIGSGLFYYRRRVS